MTNYFDDDSPFWDELASEPTSAATSQTERVRRRAPERTRTHHVVTRDSLPIPLLEDDDEATMWLEPRGRAGERLGSFRSVDPRLLSVGALAVAAVLAVPVFGSFGNSDGNDAFRSVAQAEIDASSTTVTTSAPTTSVIVVTAAVNPATPASPEAEVAGVADPAASGGDSGAEGVADASGTGSAGRSSGALAASGNSNSSSESSSDSSAPATVAALRAPANCANPYVAVAGDYWLRIARAAGVSLDALLRLNGASAETPIYPGSDLCLPAGATGTVVPPSSAPGTEAPTSSEATTTQPAGCANTYEAVVGDYWLRIADATNSSLSDLLGLNNATTETPLYPGSEVCLPAGAASPPPPSIEPPPTAGPTTEPATSEPATTPPATDPPTTEPATTQPETTVPPTPAPSGGEVEQMIRDVWPDELEEQALRIAWRESNYQPTARNFCCHGIFQMHWRAHRALLASLGITSLNQLYDARTNIEAAYALYLQAGGWGPWAMTRD